MNVLLETAFERLLSKYERTFGEQPPFTIATAEEVMAFMRRRLREAESTREFPGPPGYPPTVRPSAAGGAMSYQR